jgi:hypothetical protein
MPLPPTLRSSREVHAMNFEPPEGPPVALSFACAFAGWAAGLAWYVGRQAHASGFGYVTDLEAVRLWSALFSFAAWLAVMVPLAVFVDSRRRIFRWPWAPAFGAVCSVALLGLGLMPLAATALVKEPLFAIHAAVTGAVAWGSYVLAYRRLRGRGTGARVATLLFASPAIALVLFTVILWPALERVAPAVAYRYGDHHTRARLYERGLRSLRVGDSLEELRRRLPGEFVIEPRNASGNLASGAQYRLDVANGRVTRIEISHRK